MSKVSRATGATPFRKLITSIMFSTPNTSMSDTIAASLALSFGRITPLKPCFFASKEMGKAPLIVRIEPSKLNSPIII